MTAPRDGTAPIKVDETPGKKAYCTCGWSAALPYCDGSHKRLQTGCSSIKVEIAEAGTRWVCQCHRSANLPWCDGTHERLTSPPA
jgi:CDGSH-type Zn-finger protein